jgi:ATP-dependent RNA helicase DeaD
LIRLSHRGDEATTFASMSLTAAQIEILNELGYRRPTPIQAAFVPRALRGCDLIGQAQTGTGKTAAFLLPILERLDPDPRPQALVLGPTRELVRQVADEAVRLAGPRRLSITAIYGGHDLASQRQQLERGTHIVVGTPGRILDFLRRRTLDLSAIRVLVLDEADRMLDIGFRPDIDRIVRRMPQRRQTLLLSATMPPPVQRLAARYMSKAELIDVSADVISVESIEQKYLTVDEDRKLGLLLRLLARERPRQCIVFCQTKEGARRLSAELSSRVRGVVEMSGDLPQPRRSWVMREFRAGKIRILVATDVVGRGIDVQGISHVINYDIPEDPQVYVHRIGRTGRMGRDGKAFTFVAPEQGRLLSAIEITVNRQLAIDQIAGYVAHRRRVLQPSSSAG